MESRVSAIFWNFSSATEDITSFYLIGASTLYGQTLTLENGGEDRELLLEILLSSVGQGLVLVDGALDLLLQFSEVGLVAGNNLGLDLAGSGDDLQKKGISPKFLPFSWVCSPP